MVKAQLLGGGSAPGLGPVPSVMVGKLILRHWRLHEQLPLPVLHASESSVHLPPSLLWMGK